MIVAIYVLTGLYGMAPLPFIVFVLLIQPQIGPSFWDTGILTITRLDRLPLLPKIIPNFGLNEAFMVFGAFGLAFNINSRYYALYLVELLLTTKTSVT